MEYYKKAGELFKKHGWHNSSSVLYYNMGETMRTKGEYKSSEEYYLESLEYSRLANDDLAVATAYKGLGSLYLETGRTSKALRYMAEANAYFSEHEDEELMFRNESLDFTGQVLALQKKRLKVIVLLLVTICLLTSSIWFVSKRLKKVKMEKKELPEVFENTVEIINDTPVIKEFRLKTKEKHVIDLIAKGYTNIEIADAMCLSPETIKWYKKKLFAMFDVSNSAELVREASNRDLL